MASLKEHKAIIGTSLALLGVYGAYKLLRNRTASEKAVGNKLGAVKNELYHLGIEMGGTSCKVGIMKGASTAQIIRKEIVTTEGPQKTVQRICEWINSQPEVFASMGVAAFGPLCLDKLSPDFGSITTTPKVEWQHIPLLSMLLNGISDERKSTDFRVVFDTDCNLLAKFELENGGHAGVYDNIAYITVGTGVGVGLVVNGQYVHGLIHPEGGHVSVPRLPAEDKYKFHGVCPFHGDRCVEGLCSNIAIATRLGLRSVDEVPSLPDSHEVWSLIGYYLGTMCANLTLTLSLEQIVIGGGVMMRGDVLLDKIRESFSDNIKGYLQHAKLDGKSLNKYIVRSKFENELGLVSSAGVGSTGELYGKRKLASKPLNGMVALESMGC